MKSSFFKEAETKQLLSDFLMQTATLSMHEKCRNFEILFAEKQERKHTVFVSSGSAANLVLLQALLNLGRLHKGDRVGFSALTWATNVMPIIQLGLVPVAIDCELETLNSSPRTLRAHLGSLQAFFLTNVLGFCDNIAEIETVCRQQGVMLLEDNCEALGSRAYGRLLGNFSLASTFSFFVGHHMSTIEGGMVCTDDDELQQMVIMVRAHGWDRDLPEVAKKKLRAEHDISDFYAKYTFYDLAYNARPTEINGFLGTTQLQYWDEIVLQRQENFQFFQQQLQSADDIIHLSLGHMDVISNFSMPLVCKNQHSFDAYRLLFQEAEVEIRPVIAGDITKQPFYQKYVSVPEQCPNASFIHRYGFYFPNNPELTAEEKHSIRNLL